MRWLSLPPRIEGLITGLSFKQKVIIYLGTLAGIAALFIVLLIKPKMDEIGGLKSEMETAQSTLAAARLKAADYEKFKAEYEATQIAFRKALLLLPDKKEIPALLTSISDLGNGAGLEFLLFKPKDEVRKNFYAEIPVEIIVLGPYHSVAVFFDKVSKLPRIVGISNLNMADPKAVHGSMLIKTSCLATTYRFTGQKVEDKEAQKEGEKK
ncbi:MAG: type 4a pilus biogenesis protein PilO [Pseudomonadota bacterium]